MVTSNGDSGYVVKISMLRLNIGSARAYSGSAHACSGSALPQQSKEAGWVVQTLWQPSMFEKGFSGRQFVGGSSCSNSLRCYADQHCTAILGMGVRSV